jgi:hypothetical protein
MSLWRSTVQGHVDARGLELGESRECFFLRYRAF